LDVGVGLTTLHCKNVLCYEIFMKAFELAEFLGTNQATIEGHVSGT